MYDGFTCLTARPRAIVERDENVALYCVRRVRDPFYGVLDFTDVRGFCDRRLQHVPTDNNPSS